MKKPIFTIIFLLLGFSAFLAVRAGINTATPGRTGLVAYWSLDEGSGSIAGDFSGNENDGTLQEAPQWTDGKMGKALKLDGSGTADGTVPGDHVEVPESITRTDNYPEGATYSIWLKVDTDAVDRMSLFRGGATKNHIEIYSDSKKFRTEPAKQNNYHFGTGNFPDDVKGKWSHFVIVFANNESDRPVRWYQNGSLFHTGDLSSGDYPDTEYFSFGSIGRSTGSTSYSYAKSFDGIIDEVRVYGRALSESEIQDLYEKGLARIEQPDRTGMVGYWSLDDGSGSVAGDFSENNNDGTINGATWTDGKIGGALEFDGSDDYVDLPDNLGYSNQVSAFAWFKHKAPPPGDYHIIMGGSQLEISIHSNGYLRTGVYTDSRHVSNHGSGLNDGQWHYVGFTFDGNTKKSYIDGNFAGELSEITGILTSSFSNRRIGRYGSSGTYYLNGIVDDIRIYDRALSESKIQDLYNDTKRTVINASQNDRVTDGLVGMWSFNGPDLSGTTATDVSGNGNDGTLTNGPQPTIGKVGQALEFDGVDDYVGVSDDDSLNIIEDITISAWVNLVDNGDHSRIVSKGQNEAYQLWYYQSTNRVRFSLDSYSEGPDATTDIRNNFHHVAGVYKKSTGIGRIYVDGVEEDTYDFGTDRAIKTVPDDLIIADWDTAGSRPFEGQIDEVRIYDRALSESEIKRLYKMGR
jgi:hypothetical protein